MGSNANTMTLPKGFVLEEPNLLEGFVPKKALKPTRPLPQPREGGVEAITPAKPTPPIAPELYYRPPVADPSELPMGFIPEVESKTSFLRRMITLGGRGLWKGLGVVTWPFERIEHAIATPATALAKTITPLIREPFKDVIQEEIDTIVASPRGKEAFKEKVRAGLTPYAKSVLGERLEPLLEEAVTKATAPKPPKEDVLREEVLPALKELPSAFLTGAKAAVPYPLEKMGVKPEDLKTFNDFWGAYHKAMIGEEAPEWYKQTAGIGTSFLTVPTVFGKLLKGIGKGVKLTGIPRKIAARRLPAWQVAKMRARMKIGARVERATELGKSLGKKDLKQLANELSRQTGKKVTTQAVQQRLGQIIKGGVTTRPELAARANPVIEEFRKTSETLRKLKILPEETYLTKLSKKRIAELLKQKTQLQQQITKLQKVPYQKTLQKTAEALRVKGKTQLANRVLRLAESVEAGDVKYIKQLSKLLDVNEAQLTKIRVAGRGKVVQQLWKTMSDMNRKDPAYLTKLEKILEIKTTQPGQLRRLVESFEKARQVERGKIMQSVGKAADNLLSVDVKGINAEKLGPYAERLLRLRETEGSRIIDQLLKIGGKVEDLDISGLKPLLKKVGAMKRRFPGQAKKMTELQEKIQGVTDKIQQSYKAGVEKYLPRMYRTKEEERLARKFLGWSKHRIRAHYVKQRQKIPYEVRKMMGEIKEPAYPVVKRLIQEGSDIETAKLFEFATRQPDWVSSKWLPGLAKKPLPDTKAFGALRGKFAAPQIHSDITELNRIRGNFEQVYDTLIGSWKLGKVVLNPATHMRNKISNKILLDLSGMGFGEQSKYALRALKHYKTNSKEYQIAKRYFARTTLVKGELIDDILKTTGRAEGQSLLQKGVNATRRSAKWITKKPSEIYQHEEFTNKFMKYLQQRDQGRTILQSVQEANKWIFDYGDLAAWETKIARRVMPFYTFPRKALPRVLETAIERPLTLAKYPLMVKMTTQYSLAKLDMTPDDYEKLKEVLPDYMKRGSYMLMPYRDDNGDLRFFDWTYIVPWGELFDAQERGLLKTGITNPIFQILADFSRNKSGWTEREIWKETDTIKERTLKQLKYFWGTITPSLAPKGLYWDRLMEVATGKPSKAKPGYPEGKKRLPIETIAHTLLGLRTQAIDIQEQRRWRLYEKKDQIKELRSKMVDITMRRKSGNITEQEYEKKRDQYLKQVKEVLTGKKKQVPEEPSLPEGFTLEESK